ncbi:YoaK family protein [Undibacterium sp. TC9W]|uniref:YoaK family protein n=1 Tax=Undibacterium sp. TC9W TaxID=3413053 RepID=UPI003BF40DC5
MPINYLAKLTSPKRTPRSNLHLGVSLACVAGALNAGGFLAVGQYTSHMTGMLSSAADDLVLGKLLPAFAALFMLIAFAWGAACTAIMVNYAKRNHFRYIYTPVLLLEAVLLLVFGLVGTELQEHAVITVSFTTVLLCYVMGLQNALITKISQAEIRTTHVTGLVTDIGIELGKMMYWNRNKGEIQHENEVGANLQKLRLHGLLVFSFFFGALTGAYGFKYFGFISTLPIATALVVLSLAPRFRKA